MKKFPLVYQGEFFQEEEVRAMLAQEASEEKERREEEEKKEEELQAMADNDELRKAKRGIIIAS